MRSIVKQHGKAVVPVRYMMKRGTILIRGTVPYVSREQVTERLDQLSRGGCCYHVTLHPPAGSRVTVHDWRRVITTALVRLGAPLHGVGWLAGMHVNTKTLHVHVAVAGRTFLGLPVNLLKEDALSTAAHIDLARSMGLESPVYYDPDVPRLVRHFPLRRQQVVLERSEPRRPGPQPSCGFVGADCRPRLPGGRTAEAVPRDLREARPAAAAGHQPGKEELWPPVPDRNLGVLRLRGALLDAHLLPKIILDDPQRRDLSDDPLRFRVETGNPLASVVCCKAKATCLSVNLDLFIGYCPPRRSIVAGKFSLKVAQSFGMETSGSGLPHMLPLPADQTAG